MKEGLFIVNSFIPLLTRLGFQSKDTFRNGFWCREKILDENFLYASNIIGSKEYELIFPVKIKHKWFSKKPYLKLKTIVVKDYCKLTTKQLETFITKGFKLISVYKKELAFQEDF